MAHPLNALLHRYGGPDMGGLAGHARLYDAVGRWLTVPLYRRVVADLALVGLVPSSLVTDLGTGPGRLVLQVADAFPGVTVEGVDLSPEMVARAERNASGHLVASRVRFRQGDVAALPYADASVDVVLSTASMHHWPDIPAGIAEVRRVLRPDGLAMIYDPNVSARVAAEAAHRVGLRAQVQPLALGVVRLTLRPYVSSNGAEVKR